MKKFNCTLLVDDDPISCFINEKIIEAASLTKHAHLAHNGKEALDFIEGNCKVVYMAPSCPDLIFLDLNMPVMNGFEFLDEFVKLNFTSKPEIKIVILTSSSNPTDIERIQGYNILGYLNKPLTVENLQNLFA